MLVLLIAGNWEVRGWCYLQWHNVQTKFCENLSMMAAARTSETLVNFYQTTLVQLVKNCSCMMIPLAYFYQQERKEGKKWYNVA
jgi:hypothetical protein